MKEYKSDRPEVNEKADRRRAIALTVPEAKEKGRFLPHDFSLYFLNLHDLRLKKRE